MVRSFLDGRFENTAFCVLAPDGETRLSRSSRAPNMVLGGGRFHGSDQDVINSMNEIAERYDAKGDDEDMVLQDFHSFRQALNIASADQRVLVFVAENSEKHPQLREKLRPLFADEEIIGRFHLDFANEEGDSDWAESIRYTNRENGIILIQADQFGQSGQKIAELPAGISSVELKEALLDANLKLAQTEERKVYSDHVAVGRQEGVFFENGMPYGEDRDGDGEIDHRGGMSKGGKGGKGKGKGKGGPPR